MRVWHVDIAVQAELDITDIHNYIAYVLLEPTVAVNQVRRINDKILKLSHMPERYRIYDKEPWKSRGFRRMNIDNFAVFYVIDDLTNSVTAIAVIYAARDIDNVLSEKFS